MERFLRYSLEHDRAIRLIFLTENGGMRQVNAVVEKMTDDAVWIYITRPPQRLCVRMGDILSAGYTAKDEGQD